MEFLTNDYFSGLPAIVDEMTFLSQQYSNNVLPLYCGTYQQQSRPEPRLSHRSTHCQTVASKSHNNISKSQVGKETVSYPSSNSSFRNLPSGLITDDELLDSLKHDSTYNPTQPPLSTNSSVELTPWYELDKSLFAKAKAEGRLRSRSSSYSGRFQDESGIHARNASTFVGAYEISSDESFGI